MVIKVIIKLIFIMIILFITKLFIIKYDYHDYFTILLSFIFSFFSVIYITSNDIKIVVVLLVISISMIIYSYLRLDSSDSSIIIINGNINFKNMFKNNYSLSELFKDIKKRKLAYFDKDICAIINNNKLDIYSKSINIDKPISLIINGNICLKELYLIGKNKSWLLNRVEKNNSNIEDVFYSFYYENRLYIIKK